MSKPPAQPHAAQPRAEDTVSDNANESFALHNSIVATALFAAANCQSCDPQQMARERSNNPFGI
jgi:hypothetical protein